MFFKLLTFILYSQLCGRLRYLRYLAKSLEIRNNLQFKKYSLCLEVYVPTSYRFSLFKWQKAFFDIKILIISHVRVWRSGRMES
jgi:hypothetical protein